MRVYFLIPPGSSLVPYPAIPYLVAALRSSSPADIEVHDLNIRAFGSALQSARIHLGENASPHAPARRRDTFSPLQNHASVHRAMCAFATGFQRSALAYARRSLSWITSDDAGAKPYARVWASVVHEAERLADNAPPAAIVGMTVLGITDALWAAILAKTIKSRLPDILTVVGGAGVSRFESFLGTCRDVDVVVLGEGERTFSELAARFDGTTTSLLGTTGARVRTDSGLLSELGPRPPVAFLDTLAPPQYACLPLSSYPQHLYGHPVMPVVGSRGCIASCSFCGERAHWGGLYREHSPERIVAEIAFLAAAAPTPFIRFNDSLLNADVTRLERICDLLIRSDLQVQWLANCRVHSSMTNRVTSKMRQAGCIAVWYGIESGALAVLRRMRKGIRLEVAADVLRATSASGLLVGVFIIVNFPGETDDDFWRTCDFIAANSAFIDLLHVSEFALAHGSAIYENPAAYGLKVTSQPTRLGVAFSVPQGPGPDRVGALRHVFSCSRGREKARFPLPTVLPSI